MNQTDPARVLASVVHDIGLDLPGLLKELESIPRRIYRLRKKIAPLKAEMKLLQSRYESKGRSPSHYDLERTILLSKLKEDARAIYKRNPEFRQTNAGKQVIEVRQELTDGRAEDIAHGSPSYTAFVEQGEADRRRIAELGKEIGEHYNVIEGLKGREKYILQTIDIGKMLGYNRSAEAKL